jgi:hypothetical protein
MSDNNDIEKRKTELERLVQLERLVDRYAQSRSLGLAVPLVAVVIIAILLLGSRELLLWKTAWWSIAIVFLVEALILIGSIWLYFKLWPKYGNFFYKRDGKIKLEQERVPIWAWATYAFTFVGPAVLNELEMLSVRWALAMALASFGIFILYLGKKHKEIALGVVYGLLCLAEAVATAVGVPAPFVGRNSYFSSLMVYIIGAGLITMVVVHIYNRKVLRRIKETRPFGEQEANKSGT